MNDVAIEAADATLTYSELAERADLAARRLAALGVGPGGRVASTLAPSAEMAVLFHACQQLGAAFVPLNTRLPEPARREQALLADAAVVVEEPLADGFEADLPDFSALRRDRVAAVLFTSGTTGEPKPVELTVANLAASAAASAAAFGSDPGDRHLCVVPVFHVAGLAILARAARAGATAVLHDRFDPERVRDTLHAGEVSLVSLVATQLRRLREAGLTRAPGLRALVLGGGPIPPDLLEWAHAAGLPARCTYGMTETASQVAVTRLWEERAEPLPGVEIEIAADGEILVAGPMCAPAALAPDGFVHTGDAGSLDRHGRLAVEGRLKELIVTGGENVAPAAVEAVLLAHPSVADVAVAGRPDPEWGEAVVAYVVERTPVADYDLLSFARERLAGYQVPKRIERMERLPRNAGGKIVRGQLP